MLLALEVIRDSLQRLTVTNVVKGGWFSVQGSGWLIARKVCLLNENVDSLYGSATIAPEKKK